MTQTNSNTQTVIATTATMTKEQVISGTIIEFWAGLINAEQLCKECGVNYELNSDSISADLYEYQRKWDKAECENEGENPEQSEVMDAIINAATNCVIGYL